MNNQNGNLIHGQDQHRVLPDITVESFIDPSGHNHHDSSPHQDYQLGNHSDGHVLPAGPEIG